MSAIITPSIDLFSTPKPDRVAPVALRQIRPDDAPAMQAFVRALSPASRRLRFHMGLNELTESGLQALTRVDQRVHVAFVLTTTERGTERIVGEARYFASCDKETAEFATTFRTSPASTRATDRRSTIARTATGGNIATRRSR